MTRHRLQSVRISVKSAAKAAWRADADQPPHEQAEIEAAGVNQQTLPNIGVAAEVHAAQAPRTANAPTIAVHRVARHRVLHPVPSATIRLGNVTADKIGRASCRERV